MLFNSKLYSIERERNCTILFMLIPHQMSKLTKNVCKNLEEIVNHRMKKHGYKVRPAYGSSKLLIEFKPDSSDERFVADLRLVFVVEGSNFYYFHFDIII